LSSWSSYQEPLMLSDLANVFAMSMSRISECIKETTGQTFVQYLNDLRIRHACSLLISTEMSVSEIAYEVGYGSYKTFSRLFRDQKGVVPTIYRKMKIASDQLALN
jgi:AraC-like DNA-binding protein